MWRQTYQHQYKTKNPNLLITAVCCFPNITNTIELMEKECQTALNREDPTRLEIESMYWQRNGRDFIPIAFEDHEPRLAKLQKLNPVKPGFFWAICYKSPLITEEKPGSKSITLPPFERYLELLKYSIEKLNGMRCFWLFEETVKKYIYDNTNPVFTDFQKQKRFVQIENVSLRCLQPKNHQEKITKEEMLKFIENMQKRNIFEFMFNEFNPGRY